MIALTRQGKKYGNLSKKSSKIDNLSKAVIDHKHNIIKFDKTP